MLVSRRVTSLSSVRVPTHETLKIIIGLLREDTITSFSRKERESTTSPSWDKATTKKYTMLLWPRTLEPFHVYVPLVFFSGRASSVLILESHDASSDRTGYGGVRSLAFIQVQRQWMMDEKTYTLNDMD